MGASSEDLLRDLRPAPDDQGMEPGNLRQDPLGIEFLNLDVVAFAEDLDRRGVEAVRDEDLHGAAPDATEE